MKSLIVIWTLVLVSFVGGFGYINNQIGLMAKSLIDLTTATSQPLYLNNNLTEPSDIQPALGYRALNWTVKDLEVR